MKRTFDILETICPPRAIYPYNEFNIKQTKKVIFNGDTTIFIKDDKKYISKVHEEEFDEEKGLLMCIAKSAGYTHSELKRLLKNANRQTNKPKSAIVEK